MANRLSLNEKVMPFVKELMNNEQLLKVHVTKINGATIIDCGLEVEGSIKAGLLFTKITLGGMGDVQILFPTDAKQSPFPVVQVMTSHPILATLGCQAASWNINKEGFFGMASGPGRVLAQKPSKIFKKINYTEESKTAVLCIESATYPSEEVIDYLAKKCAVQKENLYLLLVKTASIVEYIQMAARAVELGMFRLVEQLNYPKEHILYALGAGRIPPFIAEEERSNDRINNALIYGTQLYLIIRSEPEDDVEKLGEKMISKASENYGKRFLTVFNEAGGTFENFDLSLLAPTEVIINDSRTGKLFQAGEINLKLLKD